MFNFKIIEKFIRFPYKFEKTLAPIMIFLLVFYGGNASPKLPDLIVSLFQNPAFRIFILSLIVYKGNSNPSMAILISVGFTMVMDSARPEIIEDFNRKGFRVKGAIKGAGSVLDGITRMTSFKMVIDPKNSEAIIEAFQNYSWSKSSVERPDHSYSHIPDAVRYAIMELTTGSSGKYAIDFGYGMISTKFNKSYDHYAIHT